MKNAKFFRLRIVCISPCYSAYICLMITRSFLATLSYFFCFDFVFTKVDNA